jgi:hypothetical protein
MLALRPQGNQRKKGLEAEVSCAGWSRNWVFELGDCSFAMSSIIEVELDKKCVLRCVRWVAADHPRDGVSKGPTADGDSPSPSYNRRAPFRDASRSENLPRRLLGQYRPLRGAAWVEAWSVMNAILYDNGLSLWFSNEWG